MHPLELQFLCEQWLAQPENDSAQFAWLLRYAIANGMVEPRELADHFEAAFYTVLNWAAGTATPHPRIRLQIIRKLSVLLA